MPRCSITTDGHNQEAAIEITYRVGRCQCSGEVVRWYCRDHTPWFFERFQRITPALKCERCKEAYVVKDVVKTIENLTR